MSLSFREQKEILDEGVEKYNHLSFIELDPISIPHQFTSSLDIEISGLFSALFSWGQRKTIINKSNELMRRMDDSPGQFVQHFSNSDLRSIHGFVHRTISDVDIIEILNFLQQNIVEDSIQHLFQFDQNDQDAYFPLSNLYKNLSEAGLSNRVLRHFSNPSRGSAGKRLNMFLRWMVRRDNKGVDFGIWTHIKPYQLSCPLDVHSGNIARELGLITRKQNDWKAVIELDNKLRIFDKQDPVKYDFALFGIGESQKRKS